MNVPLTLHESIIVAGLLLNLLTTIGAGAFIYGRFSAKLEAVERAVNKDGKHGFVREAEVDLLVMKADSEHRTFASEITTLRERTHGHEKVLGEHEARISVLEEGHA